MGSITKPQFLGGVTATAALIALLAALPGDCLRAPGDEGGSATAMAGEWTSPAMAAPLAETAGAATGARHRASYEVAVGPAADAVLVARLGTAFARANGTDLTVVPCAIDDCLRQVREGDVELALVSGASGACRAQGGPCLTLIGVELFGLLVPEDFPLRSLSAEQTRRLLTGAIADWRQLGGDPGPVTVVATPHAGLAVRVLAGADLVAAAVRVAVVLRVADQLRRRPGAVGVVHVGGAPPVGTRLLMIEWEPPMHAAFERGSYPFGIAVHMATNGEPAGFAAQLLAFARSTVGRGR